jgi:hypothetical protein
VSKRQRELFPELPSIKKFVSDVPELVAEWHPVKNGNKKPDDFTYGSGKKIWWQCAKGHEWQTTIDTRNRGKGCPYCSGNLPSPDYNLESCNPEIAAQWHQTKNAKTPADYTPKSNVKVWWQCVKGHEWQTAITHRTSGTGCPHCFNLKRSELMRPKASPNNNLAVTNPTLCRQWDHNKNSKPPEYFLSSSGAKVWWKCDVGSDHSWKARIGSRTAVNDGIANGCPFCSGKKASKGHNLLLKFPSVAKEWHKSKNKKTPEEYPPSSNQSVWWECQKGHEWQATINNRTSGRGCPTCSNKSSRNEVRILTELKSIFESVVSRHKIEGFEVDVFIPEFDCAVEYDGCYWHSESFKKDLNKQKHLTEVGITLLRVREEPLPQISPTDIFVDGSKPLKKVTINQLIRQVSPTDKRVMRYLTLNEFSNNDLYRTYLDYFPSPFPENSLAVVKPEIAAEWHPTKNEPLLPANFSHAAAQKVWWQCKEGHEWEATINNRGRRGCPYCAGRYATPENCMEATHPHLALMLHPTKNGEITPQNTKAKTGKILWWRCTENPEHEWQYTGELMSRRSKEPYCPFCAGIMADRNNCMASTHPHLAELFHPTKNGKTTPYNIKAGVGRKLWWRCLDHPEHEWQLSGDTMKRPRKSGYCPHCRSKRKK